MMKIDWNEDKNQLLQKTRNVSFEQVVEKIQRNDFKGLFENPAHPNQKIIVVELNDYPHIVPLVVNENGDWFLKTIYPSRKAKKGVLNGEKQKSHP